MFPGHALRASPRTRTAAHAPKVLMVIPSFWPIVGGAEMQLLRLARALDQLGTEATIVTRRLRTTATSETIMGISVHRLPANAYPVGFLCSLFVYLVVKRNQYDLIHVHTLNSPAWLCVLVGGLLRRPIVLKATRSGVGSQLERLAELRRGPLRWLSPVSWVARFVAITADVSEGLRRIGVDDGQIIRIPNGVEIGELAASVRNETSPQPMRFVFVGRLIPRKNVAKLLSAWRGADIANNAILEIIGDGPLRAELQQTVIDLGMADAVRFLGSIHPGQVASRLSVSSCLVLPSESEGMSNALLEAMASPVAVIAARIPAHSALIRHGYNGLLFRDEAELTRQLRLLATDPELRRRLAVEAGRTVRERGFAMGSVAQTYADLYAVLLGHGAEPASSDSHSGSALNTGP